MNIGFPGEGFPYTNFHDMNLDWMIKIAKDFLDQYTHIQEVIEQGLVDLQEKTDTGLEALQDKYDTLAGLLQDWYDEHSEDIAGQLADALEDLNNWYTEHSGDLTEELQRRIQEFNDLADEKVEEALASIPGDFTGVAYHFSQIDDELGYESKNLLLLNTTLGNGVFHTVNKTYTTAQPFYKHLEYTLNHERYLIIDGYAYSVQYGLWAFLDADDDVIIADTAHASGIALYNVIVPVPENAVKVIINGYVDYANRPEINLSACTYAQTIREETNFTPSKNVLYDFAESEYDKTLRKARRISDVESSDNAAFYYLAKELEGGELLYIGGWQFSEVYPAFFVLDEDSRILYKTAAAEAGFIEGCLKMPSTAKYLYVNGATYGTNAAYIRAYSEKTLDNLINIFRHDIDEASKSYMVKCGTTRVNGSITANKAKHINGSEASTTGYMYGSYTVDPGKTYLVTGYHFSNGYPLYMIYDSEGTLIEYSALGNTGSQVHQKPVTIPANGQSIIINGIQANITNGNGVVMLEEYNENANLNDIYSGQEHRKILFIGDSYSEGYSHDGSQVGWSSYVISWMGLADNAVNKYYGGARFSANAADNTYVKLLRSAQYPFNEFTDIVVAGGYNDNAYDASTILTGIQLFIDTAKAMYPFAKVHIGMIAWNKAGNGEGAIDTWQTIHANIINNVLPAYRQCVRKGAAYMNFIEYMLNDADMTPSDGYHPSALGNRHIAEGVVNYLYTGCASIRYNDNLRIGTT